MGLSSQVSHLMDGMSQILLKFCIQLGIWKKIPEPEDERSETYDAGVTALKFSDISKTASIFQMTRTFLFLKIAPKFFRFWIGNHMSILRRLEKISFWGCVLIQIVLIFLYFFLYCQKEEVRKVFIECICLSWARDLIM